MKGQITSIGESPDAMGHYPIIIIINDSGKLENKVTKGMMGVASVIIEEKPVIEYIFEVFLEKITIE